MQNKPHTLSGKSWIRTSTAGFEGDCKGEIEWGPIFKNRKDYLLTDIMVAIDKCEYEECLLSFNCYEVRDKKFVNVLNKPIYLRVTPAKFLAGTSVFVHRICHQQCRGLHGRHVSVR